MNDHLPARNQDFSNSSRNGLNDLGTKCPENNSQDTYDGRPATTPNSRAFETHSKDDRSGHSTSFPSVQGLDETRIQFNIAKDEKRTHRRERDRTFNRSNQENESSWNNASQGSRYHSKMDNVSSKDRQSQISGNRSSKENVSPWSTQPQVCGYHSKENDLSMDSRSRVSGNCLSKENESAWDGRSRTPRNDSENTSPRNNRSHEMGSTRRRLNKPMEFEDNRKSNGSPRSPTYEVCFCVLLFFLSFLIENAASKRTSLSLSV